MNLNAKQVAKQYPDLHAWLLKQEHPWAIKMMANLRNYDQLTDGQVTASLRIKAESQMIDHQATFRPGPEVVELDLAPIESAFNRAKSQGIKQPKMSLANVAFKAASSAGSNPGAIYITERTGNKTYLGKVIGGKMTLSRECTPIQVDEIMEIVKDPFKAAQAYGKQYGICCVCSRTLTDELSVQLGIGPICAERMGW
jgi:Family of unknown function (DUF6011)